MTNLETRVNGSGDDAMADSRVSSMINLAFTANELQSRHPLSPIAKHTVIHTRKAIEKILSGESDKLLGIVGPCSIHDPVAALDYAKKLQLLAQEVEDKMLLIMRTYFEKPRTIMTPDAWRGFIYDPHMDRTFDINYGIEKARELVLAINDLGLGCGTEAIDPLIVQFNDDVYSWYANGARTSEAPENVALASILQAPVGMKHNTAGNVKTAANGVASAGYGQIVPGLRKDNNQFAYFLSTGNPFAHVVMRGGDKGPNFEEEHISQVQMYLRELREKHSFVSDAVIVDLSHANSGKDPEKQQGILVNILEQRRANRRIVGFMMESALVGGAWTSKEKREPLYGESRTDPCLDWEKTEAAIRDAYKRL